MIRFKSTLKVGQMAPDFAAEDATGKLWRLADFKGHRVLLYFYPADFTSGCTAQACAFRDAEPQFRKLEVQIFGVSGDSKERHAAFSEKFGLPFRLLSDPRAGLRNAYGISHIFGRLWGRSSFLIGPEGKIEFIFNSRQNAVDHVSRSLEFLFSGETPLRRSLESGLGFLGVVLFSSLPSFRNPFEAIISHSARALCLIPPLRAGLRFAALGRISRKHPGAGISEPLTLAE